MLMRLSILALALPACLLTGSGAQALEIWQYDRLAAQDQSRFVSGLVHGAMDILTKAGLTDQAQKIAHLFPDPDRATATPLFKALLLAFPGLTIDKIIDLEPPPEPALPIELPLEPEPAEAVAAFDDAPAAGLYEEDDPGPFVAPALDPDEEDGDA